MVVAVPRKVHAVIGKTKLKQDLGTDSLAEANRLKPAIVAALQARIDRAMALEDTMGTALRLAALRREVVAAGEDPEALDLEIEDRAEKLAGQPIGTTQDGRPVFDPKKDDDAHQFHGIATGKRTPLDASRKAYLSQLSVKPRTLGDDERAFRSLVDWCKAEGVPAFREAFTKRHAVQFADDLLANSEGRSPVTLNKYITRLGLYWKFMARRGEVEGNLWQGLTYRVPEETDEEKERPFTDDEVTTLLKGPAPQHMHDLMRIAALTGARLEVIVSLRVRDCQDGMIWFKPAKKEMNGRSVPIHPSLTEIIQRRTAGKALDGDMFPEWPPPREEGSERERSFKASNHFTVYRKTVGVHELLDGKRRSRVNFHSFRRWFIQQARWADQPEAVIQSVVGHKNQSITFGTYGREASEAQLQACVEAVVLPEVTAVVTEPKARRGRGPVPAKLTGGHGRSPPASPENLKVTMVPAGAVPFVNLGQ